MEVAPEYLAEPGRAEAHLRAPRHGGSGAAAARSLTYQPSTTPLVGQSPGPVSVGHDLVQPGARRSSLGDAVARRSIGRHARSACRRRSTAAFRARRRPSRPRWQRAAADRRGAGDGLHRARHALRKLRSIRSRSSRRCRRPASARCWRCCLPHRSQRHRAHRHHPADRHRQEERHHDDRLRARGRAQRGQESARTRSSRPACCAFGRS